MHLPLKPRKREQINVRVESDDIQMREYLKGLGVDVAELYRRAIREANTQAVGMLKGKGANLK